MAFFEALPFFPSDTYYNGGTIDTTNLGGTNYEGQRFYVPIYNDGSGRGRWLRCIRNVAAFALLPKRLVTFQAGFEFMRVDGYATVNAALALPIVEEAPPSGVVPNDLTYVVEEGPALVQSALDGGADNVINEGDSIVSLTAATSGATTAGRLQSLNGLTTTPTGAQIINRIGRALSAATTANTASDVLVYIKW